MSVSVDRRRICNRVIGLERRGAPLAHLWGRPLPDPTRLVDEDFQGTQSTPVKGAVQNPTSVTGVHFTGRSRQRKTLAGVGGLAFLKHRF